MSQEILFKKLSDKAIIPKRATELSAGYDVYSAESKTISARGRALFKTNIATAFPEGHYLRVAPRSGLALKGIDVGAGVIDSDYRDDIGVILINQTDHAITFDQGDRIAQLILEKISILPTREVIELPGVGFDHKGWGSTGK